MRSSRSSALAIPRSQSSRNAGVACLDGVPPTSASVINARATRSGANDSDIDRYGRCRLASTTELVYAQGRVTTTIRPAGTVNTWLPIRSCFAPCRTAPTVVPAVAALS